MMVDRLRANARMRERAVSDETVSVIVSVDDTDDETRAVSTGKIASRIADVAQELGATIVFGITRHQLLLRDDIPYTSHNSVMVFEAIMSAACVDELCDRAASAIVRDSAPVADPGLCVACVPLARAFADDDANLWRELVAFGWKAKRDYCSIEQAYELAGRIPWASLSAHGGDESGVVGALAGVGLRLDGNDGRFRGKWDFALLCKGERPLTVGRAADRLSRDLHGTVRIIDRAGEDVARNIAFYPATEGKPILFRGAFTVVCEVKDGVAYPCKKVDLGDVGNVAFLGVGSCSGFEWDNDAEECVDASETCANCLHRRWTADGCECMIGLIAGGSAMAMES